MNEDKIQTNKPYDENVRRKYVRKYLKSEYTQEEFSRKNKISPSSLSRWIKKYSDEFQKEIDEKNANNIKEDSASKTITIPLQEYFNLKNIETSYNIICSVISR